MCENVPSRGNYSEKVRIAWFKIRTEKPFWSIEVNIWKNKENEIREKGSIPIMTL